jgi:hypothetical protein
VKALSGKVSSRLLERHGWQLLRVQGSHHIYGKAASAPASWSRSTRRRSALITA